MWRRGPSARAGTGLLVLTLLASACADVVVLEPPEIGALERRPPEQSHVYDAAGNRLAVLRKEFRERVPLARMPRHLLDAVVVAEDRRFWTHTGVDARAIVRAALRNVEEGGIEQGGSTITQQLVKSLWMAAAPRNVRTKAREALLARDLESEMSKEQILEEYLNTVYFGNGAYGVQAAAHTYWRKDVEDLELAESALLAAVIRAPEDLNPTSSPEAAATRRDVVLEAMAAQGTITDAELAAALAQPVAVAARPASPDVTQPYWVDFVTRTLLNDPTFGEDAGARRERLYGGGLRIHTTLDPRLQAAAEAATRRFVDRPEDPEVALVAVEPSSGAIVASVGGRDHRLRQFDLATQGRRQPGSAFKTFVLTAAVAAGYRPDTVVDGDQGVLAVGDGSGTQGRWTVRNFDRVSHGHITLEEATRASVNGAYARLALELGIGRVIAATRALGITSPLNDDPAIALGGVEVGVSPLEMAAAYATLANLGSHVPVSPIDRVEDADGTVVWRPDRTPRRALDPGVAWLVTQMLRTAVERGTGRQARLPGWEVAGKTGTTSHHTDAWFVGYTTELAAAVWMGHPDEPSRRPLRDVHGERVVTGGRWPARIWRLFMADALAGRTPSGFVLGAEHLVTLEVDPWTGLLAAPWCPGEQRTMPRILAPRATCPSPLPAPPPPPAPPAPGPSEATPDEPVACLTDGTGRPTAAPQQRDPGCADPDPAAGTPTPTSSPGPTPSSDADRASATASPSPALTSPAPPSE